jgi:CRISPR/Cas system endoribonuclease Cas6 (RAMP superfamily)
LNGLTIRQGEPFHFDVHFFAVRDPALPYFIEAFTQFGSEGLGPSRGRAELISVDQVPICIDLALDQGAVHPPVKCLRVRFVTPTELKSGKELADRPEFAILFARLRDRISTLRALYGEGPLEIDFRAMGERAVAIKMKRCEITHTAVERRSSRTGQRHPLGGFVGEAEYEGDLGEFVNYLKLGKWVGVGRQTVWGKGEIEVVDKRSR